MVEVTEKSTDLKWCVVVRSIGTTGISIISVLKKVLDVSEREIAERLFAAPGILVGDLEKPVAENVVHLLKTTGLDVELQPADVEFEPGFGNYEVSLCFKNFLHINEALQYILELTGINMEQAIRVVNSVPSLLLAKISENNVAVLRENFAKYNVELDVSNPAESIYDVFSQNLSFRTQQELYALATSLNIDCSRQEAGSAISLIGLEYKVAERLWREASEKRIHCTLLNRSYQRYDILLKSVEDPGSDEWKNVLIEQCRIPEKLIPDLTQKLPIVINGNVTLERAQEVIALLYSQGAEAVAELTASLSFNLEVEELAGPDEAEQILKKIGQLSNNKIREIINGKIKTVEGPFTYNQARWMIAELKKVKCKVKMIKR